MLAHTRRLGAIRAIRAIIHDVRTELLLSAASAWEIAIKHEPGRLPLTGLTADPMIGRNEVEAILPA